MLFFSSSVTIILMFAIKSKQITPSLNSHVLTVKIRESYD